MPRGVLSIAMFTGVNIRSLGPKQAVYRGKHDLVRQYNGEQNSGHAPTRCMLQLRMRKDCILTEFGKALAQRSIPNLARGFVGSSVTFGTLLGCFYQIVSQTSTRSGFTSGERRGFTSTSGVIPNGPPLPGGDPQKRQGVQAAFATAARVPQFSATASTMARIPAAAEL